MKLRGVTSSIWNRFSSYRMLSYTENLFNDNRKIGILLLTLGTVLLTLGVILLFDPVLLAMGNILFIGYAFVLYY